MISDYLPSFLPLAGLNWLPAKRWKIKGMCINFSDSTAGFAKVTTVFLHPRRTRGKCARYVTSPRQWLAASVTGEFSQKTPGYGRFRFFSFNKTGTRQCTRAVWSTFADNHSTHPGALMHYSACRSFEAKDSWTTSHCFHRISFCSRVTHVRSRNALLNITKYMSSTGILMNFGRLRLTCRDQACKQIIRRIEMADNAYLAVFAVVACCFSYFACSNGRMREENLSWLCIWKVCNGIEPLYFCGCSKQD